MGETAMAKSEYTLTSIRLTKAYREYLRRIAEQERVTMASLLDRAVAVYARVSGHPDPPKR